MAVCPNGHDSASDDFCDTCGMRIGGSPPPGSPPLGSSTYCCPAARRAAAIVAAARSLARSEEAAGALADSAGARPAFALASRRIVDDEPERRLALGELADQHACSRRIAAHLHQRLAGWRPRWFPGRRSERARRRRRDSSGLGWKRRRSRDRRRWRRSDTRRWWRSSGCRGDSCNRCSTGRESTGTGRWSSAGTCRRR